MGSPESALYDLDLHRGKLEVSRGWNQPPLPSCARVLAWPGGLLKPTWAMFQPLIALCLSSRAVYNLFTHPQQPCVSGIGLATLDPIVIRQDGKETRSYVLLHLSTYSTPRSPPRLISLFTVPMWPPKEFELMTVILNNIFYAGLSQQLASWSISEWHFSLPPNPPFLSNLG